MSIGLDLSTPSHSGAPGSACGTEINSSAGASWTSHFDDPETVATMASTAGTGTDPVPSPPPPTDNISVGQRMISATAGNILTGLLGELRSLITGPRTWR
jgi:solute carrier family 25 protein 39/40